MNNEYLQLIDKLLNNNASKSEVKQLLLLLDSNSGFDKWMCSSWENADSEIDKKTEQNILLEIKRKIQKRKQSKLRVIWNVAASVLICVLTATAYYFYSATPKEITSLYSDMTIHVEKGQKTNIVLPDGTRVWINSDSEISYGTRFNEMERVINLTGEAYFEVAKSSTPPFIVQTPNFSVKALGTSFNVKAYKDENIQTAILIEGQVEVATMSEKVILSPNQRIDYNKQKLMLTKTEMPESALYVMWREDKFIFNNESLGSIINTLSRYYNVRFEFQDEQAKQYSFSGTIENTSLESVLQIFALTSPLNFTIKDSVIILKENKNAKKYFSKITN